MSEDRVELPRYGLPLSSWLVWGPGAALLVGVVSGGLGYGSGLYEGVSALLGGVAPAAALVVTAIAVLPWREREGREWMAWLAAAQLGTLLLTVVASMVAWRAAGAEVGSLGLTAAGAFLAGQMGQTAAYASADRAARAALAEREGASGG